MKIDVKHVAKLANLTLTAAETEKFEKQLGDVLSYIEKINKLNLETIDPTSQVTGLTNVLREDETAPGLTQEEALSGTRQTHNGFFVVEQILEEK